MAYMNVLHTKLLLNNWRCFLSYVLQKAFELQITSYIASHMHRGTHKYAIFSQYQLAKTCLQSQI